ncbi:MAG: ATP-binding cassette domain-containing protein [Bacillota bacterium]
MKALLEAENLRLTISGREIFAVDSLTLMEGEVLALVGPNGAGKTSLLLTLAHLQPPTAGTIRFDGQTVRNGSNLALRRRTAVVFQESLLLNTTVLGNITTPLRIKGVPRREAETRALKWLEYFGIAHLARCPARRVSGGEAQRVSLARAFALEPEVLFLDEPFAALDYPTRNALLKELGKLLKETGTTTLFVTHDYTEIPYLARRVAVMLGGRIIKEGTMEEVFGDEIRERMSWVPWDLGSGK